MNAEIKKRWIDALRSGDYQQGREALRTDEDTYCCLGVLVDIIKDDLLDNIDRDCWIDDAGLYEDGTIESGTLPLWLRADLGFNHDAVGCLIDMNDGRNGSDRHSFSEIADYIERTM